MQCSTATRLSFHAAAAILTMAHTPATPPFESSRSSSAASLARRANFPIGTLFIFLLLSAQMECIRSYLIDCSESLVHNPDYLTIAMEDMDAFDAELADKIRKLPADYLPLVRFLSILGFRVYVSLVS